MLILHWFSGADTAMFLYQSPLWLNLKEVSRSVLFVKTVDYLENMCNLNFTATQVKQALTDCACGFCLFICKHIYPFLQNFAFLLPFEL